MMKFCPKCGTILMPKKEKNKIYFSCRCGYIENPEKVEKVIQIIKKEKEIETLEKEIEVHPLTTDTECPKCGNTTAYYWEVQTRASDEPATKFLKCEKCKHIWRDYK